MRAAPSPGRCPPHSRQRRRDVIFGTIPAGLTAADLMPQSLLNGDSVSGQRRLLAFAAAPVTLTPGERARLRAQGTGRRRPDPRRGRRRPGLGLLLHRGRGWRLLIAALVAWLLSRRMSRPLVEARDATARIAAGTSRAGCPSGSTTTPSRPRWRARSTRWRRASKTRGAGSASCCWPSRTTCAPPLTSIRGFAEAITDGAVEDTAQAAEVIIAESRRLERLVGDLLDLTKLEANQMSISSDPRMWPKW